METPLLLKNMTTDQKAELAYKLAERARNIATVALILALLGLIGVLVSGLIVGLGNQRQYDQLRSDTADGFNASGTALANTYTTLHNEILLLRQNAFDAIMNVSGGSPSSPYTRVNVLNGTFEWRDDYGLIEPADYSVDLVTIGPLNFQLLTLAPPANPLIINPFSAGIFTFRLVNFNPFVSQLVQAPQTGTGVISIPLTSANAAKISITSDGGCFANYYGLFPPAPPPVSPFCFERGRAGDQASTSRNSLVLLSTNPALGATYYLAGDIVSSPSNHLDGQAFTLSAPWELVLDAF